MNKKISNVWAIAIIAVLAVLTGGVILSYAFLYPEETEYPNTVITKKIINKKPEAVKENSLVLIKGQSYSNVKVYFLEKIENAEKIDADKGIWALEYQKGVTNPVYAEGFDSSGNLIEKIDIPSINSKSEFNDDSQTNNWKKHKNNQYGFEFKYPTDWFIADNLTANTCCLNIFNHNPEELDDSPGIRPGKIKIQFNRYNNTADLKNYVSSLTFMESDIKATIIEDINVAGIKGVRSNLMGSYNTYYLPETNYSGVSILVFINPDDILKFEETISQLLSTFKFTK